MSGQQTWDTGEPVITPATRPVTGTSNGFAPAERGARKGRFARWLAGTQRPTPPPVRQEGWLTVHVWDWDRLGEAWIWLRSTPYATTYAASKALEAYEGRQATKTTNQGWEGSCGCTCRWGNNCAYYYLGSYPTCGHPGCGLPWERRTVNRLGRPEARDRDHYGCAEV